MKIVGLVSAAALAAMSSPRAPQSSRPGGVDAAQARKIIAEGNVRWGKARVAFDTATFEEMLGPDFYVQLDDRRIERKEYVELISAPSKAGKATKFDATVLTVQPAKDGWNALIQERIEFERPDGKPGTIYSLWITRDAWRKVNDRWVIAYSEALGNESWRGGDKPPFRDW